ncbi:MAG: hypothetical protein CMJ58_18585 [Planctomycetaceae bacterium]|nr:hypothetical protein [Planctomycetaceae bacterium]
MPLSDVPLRTRRRKRRRRPDEFDDRETVARRPAPRRVRRRTPQEPEARRGVSVTWWLAALTFAALAAAALVNPRSWWAPLLTEAALAAQVVAVATALFARGQRRAAAGGYAIGSGLILVAEFVPVIGRPIIHRLLPWTLWSPDSALRVGSVVQDRAYVGIIVAAFVYGYLGSLAGRAAFRRRPRQRRAGRC